MYLVFIAYMYKLYEPVAGFVFIACYISNRYLEISNRHTFRFETMYKYFLYTGRVVCLYFV